jgi:uncharacterized protein (DUF2267 family)
MTATGLDVFDTTLQKTNVWLKEIEAELGPDRHRSYEAMRAVLHALRDRLSVDEAAHLGDQLPMLVRGIYYEGYHPAGKPEKLRSLDEFLERVSARLRNVRPIGGEEAARATFRTISRNCDPGEVRQVLGCLPAELRSLWPDHERYMRENAAMVD